MAFFSKETLLLLASHCLKKECVGGFRNIFCDEDVRLEKMWVKRNLWYSFFQVNIENGTSLVVEYNLFYCIPLTGVAWGHFGTSGL